MLSWDFQKFLLVKTLFHLFYLQLQQMLVFGAPQIVDFYEKTAYTIMYEILYILTFHTSVPFAQPSSTALLCEMPPRVLHTMDLQSKLYLISVIILTNTF